MSERDQAIARLRRERPRSRFARLSGLALLALAGWAWLGGQVSVADALSARRRANLARFLREDLLPAPVRGEGGEGLAAWCLRLWSERGAEAFAATLWIALAAIALAGLAGALAAPLGARTLMSRHPWGEDPGRDAVGGERRGLPWRTASAAVRFALVLLRAIPEYVWAFLLLAVLGPGAWPAVLALAIHNAGILGRLGADTIENLDRAPLAALRGLGATRAQVVATAVAPLALPRWLLYLFYRFETCAREATVLGMLGVVSLGYHVQDARARMHYDELIWFIGLGALLVLAADLASIWARGFLRRAR